MSAPDPMRQGSRSFASIITLVRGDDVIMAHHDTVLENGDHVILFVSDKRHVEQVERLFQS